MKPINQMNERELADYIQYPAHEYVEVASRLRELYEQRRWIPVSERMPTEEDGRTVLVINANYGCCTTRWDEVDKHVQPITHWQRITPPEPPDYDRTFCTSDFCESTHECARHIIHYQFEPGRPVWLWDFTNLVQECEHFEPLPEAKP